MPVLGEGQIFERYRIIKWLGNGSAGESYEVEDRMLLRKATLKLIHPWAMLPDSARRQFFREMQGISVLTHRHLAPVLDYGEIDGRIYVARRYISSGSLLGHNGRLWFKPPLALASTFRYANQLAQALHYIHLHGYTHGSLTFANVLVLRGQNLENAADFTPFLLADVGLSHFVRRFGRPGIEALPVSAAPEQINKRTLPASDQFALAVLIYFWLTGRPPYLGTPLEVEQQKRSETITSLTLLNPGVTQEQDAIIRRALLVNPDKRHPSVLAFAEALMSTLPAELPVQSIVTLAAQMRAEAATEPEIIEAQVRAEATTEAEIIGASQLAKSEQSANNGNEPAYPAEQSPRPQPEPHLNPITPLPALSIDPITPIPASPVQEESLSLLEQLSAGSAPMESNFPLTAISSPPLTPYMPPHSFAFPVDDAAPIASLPAPEASVGQPEAPLPPHGFVFPVDGALPNGSVPVSAESVTLPEAPLPSFIFPIDDGIPARLLVVPEASALMPEAPVLAPEPLLPDGDETLPPGLPSAPEASALMPEAPVLAPEPLLPDDNDSTREQEEPLAVSAGDHRAASEQPKLSTSEEMPVFTEESPVLAVELADTTLDLANIMEAPTEAEAATVASPESDQGGKAGSPAPQADTTTPRLIISPPYSNSSYEFLLTSPETNVGRAGASDLLLDQDNLTSRHHALIKRVDERVVIYDKRSNNGVFVNGQRIEHKDGYELVDGDHISIGNYELIFRDTLVH